ncbi:aldo/keto reductase [Catellatospora sp. NPDC049609]|uniref:aldo/keto reductase n=1 Tax=Catellatospora sp. NPDC049609 TaxID=3155505 RepID=UPI0034340581
MQQRTILDRTVGAIGLGALPLSVEGRPDRAQALRTVHAAVAQGVTLIDTADCYGIGQREHGHNEQLLAQALAALPPADRDAVMVATKGGMYRTDDGAYHRDARPERLRAACEASLRALGRDAVDLYQLHAVDPAVPFLESVGALADLQREGKVRMVGLSNVTVAEIEAARTLVTVASVQNRFSAVHRDSNAELAHCAATGIAFLPWAPLGGLAVRGGEPDRSAAFRTIAAARGWSVQRVCLAWMLSLGDVVIPIPGASRPESIQDSARAADASLTPGELDAIIAASAG